MLGTRIAGNDGVSLESKRWKEILERMGHEVTFVAGELDTKGILIPELRFTWPKVVELHDKIVYGDNNYKEVEREIFEVAGGIEGQLRELFNGGGKVDLLIVPNVFSIPMHFPLAVGLARVIEEYRLPTIARHHDFWWERKRFLKSTMFDFFEHWFPPNLPSIKHVVINSIAQEELLRMKGIKAVVIPDTFDFGSDINKIDSYSMNWRKDFGIKKEETVFLQPTRVVPRKRIELSIELLIKLNDPGAVLVVAGQSGDEGKDYETELQKRVREEEARVLFIGKYVNSERKIKTESGMGQKPKRRRVYTLWDCFTNCDFVTYPTMLEGFGNQFIESAYFKKPIIMTPYEVYKADIKPLGFEVVEMPQKVTKETVDDVKALMKDQTRAKNMTETNFRLGERYFSYEATEKKLRRLLTDHAADY